jgi:hypothetical protein
LTEQWCLAPTADPEFVWHVADGLAADVRPFDPTRPVVCLDETTANCSARSGQRFGDQDALTHAATTWVARRNAVAAVDWRFTTADARIKLKRLYPTFED